MSVPSALKASRKTIKLRGVGVGGGPGLLLTTTATRRGLPAFGSNQNLDMSLTMAQGIKRLGMPIAALLGVALIALVATSWLLNRDSLRDAVEAQIRAVTGLDLVIKGDIDISVFPRQLRLLS